MKVINVVAAIVIDDGKIFATQRGYGEFAGGWEFPGGKIETGETSQEALVRELREELNMDVHVGRLFERVEYDYPNFHLTMECFLCTMKSDSYILKEHKAAKWIAPTNLDDVDWLPADIGVVEKLKLS